MENNGGHDDRLTDDELGLLQKISPHFTPESGLSARSVEEHTRTMDGRVVGCVIRKLQSDLTAESSKAALKRMAFYIENPPEDFDDWFLLDCLTGDVNAGKI